MNATTQPSRPDARAAAFAMLAVLALAALLAAFVQVVHAGMRAGDARRRAVAEEADALWRCSSQPGSTEREACTLRVKAARTTH